MHSRRVLACIYGGTHVCLLAKPHFDTVETYTKSKTSNKQKSCTCPSSSVPSIPSLGPTTADAQIHCRVYLKTGKLQQVLPETFCHTD